MDLPCNKKPLSLRKKTENGLKIFHRAHIFTVALYLSVHPIPSAKTEKKKNVISKS